MGYQAPHTQCRTRWRALRARRLATEQAADEESRLYEEREADNLRKESEEFLARQMDEMQALQDEQRKAGMLLDDGAPVKLNVSLAAATAPKAEAPPKEKATVFGQEEEEEESIRKRKAPLPRLDLAEGGEKAKERLEKIRESVTRDKETLFKSKVRWDGLSDVRPPSSLLDFGEFVLIGRADHDRSQAGANGQAPDDEVPGRAGG